MLTVNIDFDVLRLTHSETLVFGKTPLSQDFNLSPLESQTWIYHLHVIKPEVNDSSCVVFMGDNFVLLCFVILFELHYV